jgi:hypothetical protein
MVRTCVSFSTQGRSSDSILTALGRSFERAEFSLGSLDGSNLELKKDDARMFLSCERSEDRWVIFLVPPAEGLVSLGLVIETEFLRFVVATLHHALTSSRAVAEVLWHDRKEWNAGRRSNGVPEP